MPNLSPKLRTLVGAARDIATTITARTAVQDDRDARWPEETMRALREARLTALNAPIEVGGHGEGMVGIVAVTEALADESASAALCFAMHCVGTAVIAVRATNAQRERYLVPIASGEHLTSLALSEPGSGAIFFYPETTLEPTATGFRLDGTKSFVTNGSHADSYVISTAAVEVGDELEGVFSCVVVDNDLPGLEWTGQWQGLGMRSNDSRTMRLSGVELPADRLLGARGDQLWYIFEVIAPYFLMAMAGTYLGTAQAALDEARLHVGTRRHGHSGELLGQSSVVSHRLGEMWTRVEATRQLIYAAAAKGDARAPDALTSILGAKSMAADTAVTVANEAMTLCGGSAYRDNSRLARIFRDARASHVMGPTTDMLKTWIGRALLNLPLL